MSAAGIVDQATFVASHITDRAALKQAVPGFWSTQYDLPIQMACWSRSMP
ncbi:hypothetical protein [Paraburkholderia sp.]|nr:hypothetical protein [Paraburkholderia sp.]